jgi:hypothetical protein
MLLSEPSPKRKRGTPGCPSHRCPSWAESIVVSAGAAGNQASGEAKGARTGRCSNGLLPTPAETMGFLILDAAAGCQSKQMKIA